jgi:hypothetical protein
MPTRSDSSAGADRAPVLADSITDVGPEGAGAIVVTGSHAGRTTAGYALARGVAALIAHDAGIGLDRAGVAALALLDAAGTSCCAIGAATARIGDAQACAATGRIAHVNAAAARLGVRPGCSVADAVDRLRSSPPPGADPGPVELVPPRRLEVASGRAVWLLDSAAGVDERHADAVVVTGSHGELLGGRDALAIRSPVFAAVFNDAGMRAPGRLAVLGRRGIAAVTVAAASARIGDAESTYATGAISAANTPAERLGARVGMSAREFATRAARA